MISTPLQECLDEIISSRRSVRAFLTKAVDKEDLKKILEISARAPSGGNTQPWKVYVLTGDKLKQLSEDISAVHGNLDLAKTHVEEYHYYPVKWISPFADRRRKVGWDLYSLLGISRENKAGMHAQHGRNYQFFDAPVGLIFTIDRVMEQGSWLDYGMFLQNIMLTARARGLDTCPQAAFTQYHKLIRDSLQLPENEMVVCGMSLGFADVQKIENTLITEREPVENFVKFFD